MSQLLHIDAEYKQWIQALSLRYRRSRIKASMRMNSGYMKRWYLFYNQHDTKLQQLVEEISSSKLHQVAAEILHQRGGEKLQQPVAEFQQLKERMELLQKELRETKRLMKANK